MSSDTSDIRSDLKRIGDEIRVRIHLAGMEAKDLWSKLEPRLTEFEQRAENVAGRLADELVAVGTELKQDLEKLSQRVQK